ncbi:MAG: NAD(P)/FAD-dependent oxidoreductase [Candidatus Dormibacteria bacterium]
MNRTSEVVVVGAGIIGCTLALRLAQAGRSVVVVEAGDVGGQTSRAAAGLLAPWCEAREPGPYLELGARSLRSFGTFETELIAMGAGSFDHRRTGTLWLALDEEQARAGRERLSWTPAGAEWLDESEVRRRYPMVGRCVGGILYPDEAQVTSAALLESVVRACEQNGVRFRTGCRVTGFEVSEGRVRKVRLAGGGISCAEVVITTGAWAAETTAELGFAFPLTAIRGQILSLECARPPVEPAVLSGSQYIAWKPDGRIYVGTTEDLAGFDREATAAGVAELLAVSERLLPASRAFTFGGATAGLRPRSGDGLPAIGRVPGCEGAWLAAGHYRNGLLWSLVTADLLSSLMGGSPVPELIPFDPARLAAG